jgi:surface protein
MLSYLLALDLALEHAGVEEEERQLLSMFLLLPVDTSSSFALQQRVRWYCYRGGNESELARLLLGSISGWEMTGITSLEEVFYGCYRFNEPIEDWDVSEVTSMQQTFETCTHFNQPLAKWNVSRVTDFRRAFFHAHRFNQPLNSWQLTNDRGMRFQCMFTCAYSFNQPLDSWRFQEEVDDAAFSFHAMFGKAVSFRQSLDSWPRSIVSHCELFFREEEEEEERLFQLFPSIEHFREFEKLNVVFCPVSWTNYVLSSIPPPLT